MFPSRSDSRKSCEGKSKQSQKYVVISTQTGIPYFYHLTGAQLESMLNDGYWTSEPKIFTKMPIGDNMVEWPKGLLILHNGELYVPGTVPVKITYKVEE